MTTFETARLQVTASNLSTDVWGATVDFGLVEDYPRTGAVLE